MRIDQKLAGVFSHVTRVKGRERRRNFFDVRNERREPEGFLLFLSRGPARVGGKGLDLATRHLPREIKEQSLVRERGVFARVDVSRKREETVQPPTEFAALGTQNGKNGLEGDLGAVVTQITRQKLENMRDRQRFCGRVMWRLYGLRTGATEAGGPQLGAKGRDERRVQDSVYVKEENLSRVNV